MDIHTHILPGIDDGSQSMEQTKAMLKQAYDEGVRVIVATPHFGIRNAGFRLSEAEEILKETQAVANEITPGLKLVLGNELYYTDGIVDSLKRGEARTVGGTSYALVEFSTVDKFDRISQCVREFMWNGYIPLIAHIERYRCLENEVDLVRQLVRQGAVIQVNCRSFTNGVNASKMPEASGSRDKKGGGLFSRGGNTSKGFSLEMKSDWVRKLMEEGLVHFIASDCHDDETRRPAYRSTLEAIEGWADADALQRITKTNVLKLIRNERI